MIPLYGFLQGDTIGLLVLADENDTAAVLAQKLQASARVRVRPEARVKVMYKGQVIDDGTTVAQAVIQPLDRFDVIKAGAP
jgi:hypothetical protein